jgi:hypothetical protein
METIEHSPEMLKAVIAQLTQSWKGGEKNFCEAVDGSERRRVQLKLDVVLDCAEMLPVVSSDLSWKRNVEEGKLKVVKTYHTGLVKSELEDPQQQALLPAGDSGAKPAKATPAAK